MQADLTIDTMAPRLVDGVIARSHDLNYLTPVSVLVLVNLLGRFQPVVDVYSKGKTKRRCLVRVVLRGYVMFNLVNPLRIFCRIV